MTAGANSATLEPETLPQVVPFPPSLGQLLGAPLPGLADSGATRFWVKVFLAAGNSRILNVRGVENIAPSQGAFILVANHNQRLEALLLPALLAYCRQGHLVHFFTDWLVMLYPVIGSIVMLHDPIVITQKKARIDFLNRFKHRFETTESPLEKARRLLGQGGALGIFPEGTMNRDRSRLLRGHPGAAQLSLSTGVPIVPAGIRFPGSSNRLGPISDLEPMEIEFGTPLRPPSVNPDLLSPPQIRDWHGEIMQAVSRLSGKQWSAKNQRTRYVS